CYADLSHHGLNLSNTIELMHIIASGKSIPISKFHHRTARPAVAPYRGANSLVEWNSELIWRERLVLFDCGRCANARELEALCDSGGNGCRSAFWIGVMSRRPGMRGRLA